MRMLEALQKIRYAQKDHSVGDQFEAETDHARALVAARKAKYSEPTVRTATAHERTTSEKPASAKSTARANAKKPGAA